MSRRHPPQSHSDAGTDAVFGAASDGVTGPFAQDREVVVLRLRRHGRRLVFPVLLLLVLAAAAGYWIGALPEPWMNVVAGAGALLAAFVFVLLPLFSWLAQRTTITTRRVILRHGFFVRHRTEVALSRVREVRSRRGIVQRMHGSGDIELLIGSDATLLRDVPGVEAVVDALQELTERSYASSMAQQHAMTQRVLGQQYGTTSGFGGTALPGRPAGPSFFDPGDTPQ